MMILKILFIIVLVIAAIWGLLWLHSFLWLFKFYTYKSANEDISVPEKYRMVYRQWCMDCDKLLGMFPIEVISSWSVKDKKKMDYEIEKVNMYADLFKSFLAIGSKKDLEYVSKLLRVESKEMISLGKKYGVV